MGAKGGENPMRYVLALLLALALCSVASPASAQELLSGDSVVPWGCGWSPNGAYYQPCSGARAAWSPPPVLPCF
jgi:hypothetical protein